MSEEKTQSRVMAEADTGSRTMRTWFFSNGRYVAIVEIDDDTRGFQAKINASAYVATVQTCVMPPEVPKKWKQAFGTFEHAECWALAKYDSLCNN